MQRYAECLRTMYVSKTNWISNNGSGNKRNTCRWIRRDTRPPATINDVFHHSSFSLDVALAKRFHIWNQPRIFDHILLIKGSQSAFRVNFVGRLEIVDLQPSNQLGCLQWGRTQGLNFLQSLRIHRVSLIELGVHIFVAHCQERRTVGHHPYCRLPV